MGNLHTKICGAYLKRFSGLNSQREKKERYSYLYMFRKVVEVQSSNVLTSLLEIFIFGVTKKPQCFSYTWKWRDTSTSHSDACQTTRSLPGTFEVVWHSLLRRVHACTDLGGSHFEYWLRIVTLQATQTQQL
jgi:hypothetical protein